MSYIIRAGNLAGPVKLTMNNDGTYSGRATVIVNDRAKNTETGKWDDVATTAYYLRLNGNAAVKLHDFHELNGNAAVIFAGSYRQRTYTDEEGSQRTANDVWVDHIGADLTKQELHIITQPTTKDNK